MDKLVASVVALAGQQERIKSDVAEIKADVKTFAEKPGKRWDGMVDLLIFGVAVAVLGFLLGRIGLQLTLFEKYVLTYAASYVLI